MTITVSRWEPDKDFTSMDVEVYLGDEITKEVQGIFSNGQCHALAVALHDLTGWPIVGLSYYGPHIQHMAVERPDGFIVDAYGPQCNDFCIKRIVKRKNAVRKRCGWLIPNLEAARHFAPIFLRDMDRLFLERIEKLRAKRDRFVSSQFAAPAPSPETAAR